MRRFTALAAWLIAACASPAEAGDVPTRMALTLPTACVPSADETVGLPAPGGALAVGSRDGRYGKSCDGVRDGRWVAEVVDAHDASFRVQAATVDGSDARVELAVYGWVSPHWVRHEYLPGHWQELAAARGPGVAWAAIDPADERVPYTMVRLAARAGEPTTLPVVITVTR